MTLCGGLRCCWRFELGRFELGGVLLGRDDAHVGCGLFWKCTVTIHKYTVDSDFYEQGF